MNFFCLFFGDFFIQFTFIWFFAYWIGWNVTIIFFSSFQLIISKNEKRGYFHAITYCLRRFDRKIVRASWQCIGISTINRLCKWNSFIVRMCIGHSMRKVHLMWRSSKISKVINHLTKLKNNDSIHLDFIASFSSFGESFTKYDWDLEIKSFWNGTCNRWIVMKVIICNLMLSRRCFNLRLRYWVIDWVQNLNFKLRSKNFSSMFRAKRFNVSTFVFLFSIQVVRWLYSVSGKFAEVSLTCLFRMKYYFFMLVSGDPCWFSLKFRHIRSFSKCK